MMIVLKNFYLNTSLERYEYILIPTNMISENIMHEYKLHDLTHNGGILAKIRKSMYGLSHVGRIFHEALLRHIKQGGYHPTQYTPGLFKHKTKPLAFCLIVDDFGVKYNNK